ncbi:NAD(P)-binding protein [Novosphingobium sp. RD2P27]|uniref:NAD(P)-binding protein n=1 Tax=Novosphingobium kalidii TaxID=3230299 RepID=A0ABV2D0T1_9SPHN
MVTPILVIGGGLAGGAVATRLAQAGRAVTVLEREAGPHEKVCGEFLSVEACSDLERLGLDPARLGGVAIDCVRVHRGRHTVETGLPFVARGLSRAVLDEALLEEAATAGAEVVRGVRVTGLCGQNVSASDGERTAEHILLATGKHDLRGHARTPPATRGGYIGFKMHWRLPRHSLDAIGSAIELVLFGHGYAGLQRVAAREANLCLVVKRSHFAELGNNWERLLASLLREQRLGQRLEDAEPLFAKPLAIANLPYGYLHRARADEPAHVWRLGDQAAMTASLSGDGMAVALRSAHVAADCLVSGAPTADFQRLLSAQTSKQVRRAMRLQRLSERPFALGAGLLAARLWPGLLALGARATRLPFYPEVHASRP